jgi:hypothetical protein
VNTENVVGSLRVLWGRKKPAATPIAAAAIAAEPN